MAENGNIILDALDRRLLRYWQAEPSLSMQELAERAGATQGRASRRVARMQEAGIVRGTRAVIDWAALGYTLEVSLRITLDKTQRNAFDAFLAEARLIPEVIEMQTFLGRVDVRLSVIARDLAHYQTIWRERILTLPHIADVEALMHVARIKNVQELPV